MKKLPLFFWVLLIVLAVAGSLGWYRASQLQSEQNRMAAELEERIDAEQAHAADLEALRASVENFLGAGRVRFEGTDAEVLEQMADALQDCFEAEMAELQRIKDVERMKAEEDARPKPNTLALESQAVEKVAEGYSATFVFNPVREEAVGAVALVVRLPKEVSSRILSLEPVGGNPLKGVTSRLADDGKFMVYQGTLETPESLTFELRVSGPGNRGHSR